MKDDLPSSEHRGLSPEELTRIREVTSKPYHLQCVIEGPRSRGDSDITDNYDPRTPYHTSNHKL